MLRLASARTESICTDLRGKHDLSYGFAVADGLRQRYRFPDAQEIVERVCQDGEPSSRLCAIACPAPRDESLDPAEALFDPLTVDCAYTKATIVDDPFLVHRARTRTVLRQLTATCPQVPHEIVVLLALVPNEGVTGAGIILEHVDRGLALCRIGHLSAHDAAYLHDRDWPPCPLFVDHSGVGARAMGAHATIASAMSMVGVARPKLAAISREPVNASSVVARAAQQMIDGIRRSDGYLKTCFAYDGILHEVPQLNGSKTDALESPLAVMQ